MRASDDSADFALGSEIYINGKPSGYGLSGERPR